MIDVFISKANSPDQLVEAIQSVMNINVNKGNEK